MLLMVLVCEKDVCVLEIEGSDPGHGLPFRVLVREKEVGGLGMDGSESE